jgi:hypothetical protein
MFVREKHNWDHMVQVYFLMEEDIQLPNAEYILVALF